MPDSPNVFFLLVIATIAIARIWLYSRPVKTPTIRGIKIHHYMYGIVLMIVSLFTHSIALYAVGFGLIVDEMPLVFFSKTDTWTEYESKRTFTAILVLIVLVFVLRNFLTPSF